MTKVHRLEGNLIMAFNILIIRKMSFVLLVCMYSSTLLSGMERSPASQVSAVQTNDCALPKRNLLPDELPTRYVHCPITQQIKNYRENIYDLAFKEYGESVKDLDTKPVPGLEIVLENAFALVHDFIIFDKRLEICREIITNFLMKFSEGAIDNKDKIQSIMKDSLATLDKPTLKIEYPIGVTALEYLENFMDDLTKELQIASKEIRNSEVTPLDIYKERIKRSDLISLKDPYLTTLEELWKRAVSYEDKLTTLLFVRFNLNLAYIIDAYKERKEIDDSVITENFGNKYSTITDHDLGVDSVSRIFIIYGNPNPKNKNRNISPNHFVEQFVAENYSSYISFFDILSIQPVIRTKKDPHWSLENGTYKMLQHDLQHNSQQNAFCHQPPIKEKQTELKEIAQNIYNIQQKHQQNGENNEATILMDGLFLLIHESAYSVIEPGVAYCTENETDIRKIDLSMLTKRLKENTTLYVNKYQYGEEYYKEERRDWEFILKDKYIDTKDNNKIKPVHDKDGKPFLPIEYIPELKKMTRPFGDISPLNEKDPKKNKKRRLLMVSALLDGYSRFWDYFLYLIENSQT